MSLTRRSAAGPARPASTVALLHSAIGLDDWSYDRYFRPWINRDWDKAIPSIEAYIASISWSGLPFFDHAYKCPELLKLWTSQEIITTNAFSQAVLAAASTIPNVHLRAVLSTVAQGEHGWVDSEGHATDSHPWLLHLLRESLNIPAGAIQPIRVTRDFICFLEDSVADPISAAATIGVGNERLLIPEYQEIEACFEAQLPDARFKPFLHANLTEDEIHYRLCYDAATHLIGMEGGAAGRDFEAVAIDSINIRINYLQGLLDHHYGLSKDEKGKPEKQLTGVSQPCAAPKATQPDR